MVLYCFFDSSFLFVFVLHLFFPMVLHRKVPARMWLSRFVLAIRWSLHHKVAFKDGRNTTAYLAV